MIASPSQRWSSAVQDLFACARGRLPAAFLERKLADLGISDVKPLPREDLQRFEKAVDLVNALIANQPPPGGKKPDVAMAEAFPDGHPTLTGMRAVAQAYIAAMRPQKARRPEPAPAASQPPAAEPPRGQGHGRHERDRGPMPERRERAPERREPRPAPPPRPPRITWEQWLEQVLPARHPAKPAEAAAATPAPTPTVSADGAAAAPATAPEAAAAPAPAAEPVFVPPALVNWQIDGEARRQLARIRERHAAVIAAKDDPAAALRELAFSVLRPPMAVRDDLRGLLAESLQRQGVAVTMAALYPPPPVAALKRDWENLLAARGPADPSVEQAWRKLVDNHPEARAKLESERREEFEELARRFADALVEFGEADNRTAEARTRLESRHVAAERIAAELARVAAVTEAAAHAGRLIAERGWEDPEVVAAIAALGALNANARQRLESQRRHELDELDRRVRTASREHGPAGEATVAALERLRARFPAEGAAAAARLDRIRRGEDLTQQERERRESGKSLSAVHIGATEHRLTRIHAAPRWRLVVAVVGGRPAAPPKEAAKDGGKERPERKDGKEAKDKEAAESRPRRGGHAVAWLVAGPAEHGPVAAGWRAPDCGSLDELDACVQAVADRAGGVIGLPLADCAERGGAWADAAWTLAALAALTIPVAGATEIAVELPAWAEIADAAAFDASLAALGGIASADGRSVSVVRAPAADHATALAEAVAWSWSGRRDAESARIRQSGLLDGCLIQPGAALRDAVAQLGTGALPAWSSWSTLLADAEPGGIAEALLARIRAKVVTEPDAILALHRHLAGLARGRIADPDRLVRELAWLDGVSAALRPRDRLRLDGAVVAAQAAAGRIEPAVVERLVARLTELREDWPAEVLESALHAAAHAREGLDSDAAEALLAPWARAEAIACGGRALLVRLCEERARIAAGAGRWKDARKHLERAGEAVAKLADAGDREAMGARIAALHVAVLSDDPTVAEDEARATLSAAILDGADPIVAAGRLAVDGAPRHAHLAVLRWAVRRQDEVVASAYLGKRETWCEPREAAGLVLALRAVLLAPADAEAARRLLIDANDRLGGGAAPTATRLSLLACAVGAALHGAALADLRERLTALRRERPAATPAVEALERALALAPDVKAGLGEALPLLAR